MKTIVGYTKPCLPAPPGLPLIQVRKYIAQNLMFPIQHSNTVTYYGVTDVLTTNVTHVYAYTINSCMQCLTKAITMKYG